MNTIPLPPLTAEPERRRNAAVVIITMLLLGQALLLLTAFPGLLLLAERGDTQPLDRVGYVLSDGLRLYREGAWTITPEEVTVSTPAGPLSAPTSRAASIWFVPLAPLALLTALLFFALYRPALTLALLLQCAVLFVALRLYVTFREPYICLLMLPAVLLIGYLNQFEIRTLFDHDVRRAQSVVRNLSGKERR